MAKKKRYYQSSKDRMDERMGMRDYYDKMGYHGAYAVGGRMNAKSPMISEEYNEPSNLPRDVKMKQYPRLDYISQKVYDSMEGVDRDINDSVETANRHMNKRRRY